MKITVEISDPLLRKLRKLAARKNVTLRSLVERGLRQIVGEAKQQKPFKLRNLSFKGNGLRPGLRDAPWSTICDMITKVAAEILPYREGAANSVQNRRSWQY